MIYHKRNIVVDFIGYNLPDYSYAIKEFSAVINKNNSEPDFKLLVLPPYKFSKLSPKYRNKYINFYETHAITWESGETPHNNVAGILTSYFENAKHIYVRNTIKKKILEMFIGERDDIECLEDLGFREKFQKSTLCDNHDVPSYCAINNSMVMLRWLELNKARKASLSKVRLPENRVFFPVSIKGRVFSALLDTGATATCIRKLDNKLLEAAGMSSSDRKSATGADGHVMRIEGSVRLPLVINNEMVKLDVRVVPKLGYEMILGIDAVQAFGIGLDGASCTWWTKRRPGIFSWDR